MKNPKSSLFNLFLRIRPVLRWVLKLRSSAQAIALGLGLGTFLAFTPTFGIQVILAIFLATLLNANRPASLVPVFITNPVTIVPIYTSCYWVGKFFWPGPPVSEVSKLLTEIVRNIATMKFWEIGEQLYGVFHLSKEVLIPLVIGCLLVGLVFGGAVYTISLPLLKVLLLRRRRKNAGRNRKRQSQK